MNPTARSQFRIAILGLGNIGSHVVPLVARLSEIAEICLIDGDRYDASNLVGQNCTLSDIGRWKVDVQHDVISKIQPDALVTTYRNRIESLPLAKLNFDFVLCCVDSRRSRQITNETCTRLGKVWFDAAVGGGISRAARVSVFAPHAHAPCLECNWSEDDYAAIEQAHPCAQEVSTGGTASTGALAAALMVAELEKLICGQFEESLIGREVWLDVAHHQHWVTAHRRNPQCRFDHQRWALEDFAVNSSTTLADLGQSTNDATLSVRFDRFYWRRVCGACGCESDFVGLAKRTPPTEPRCSCGGDWIVDGLCEAAELPLAKLTTTQLSCRCVEAGLQHGDVVTVRHAGECRHLNLMFEE